MWKTDEKIKKIEKNALKSYINKKKETNKRKRRKASKP